MQEFVTKITISEKARQRLIALGTETVYLFGSYAEETAQPLSDIDFAILMRDSQKVSFQASTLELYQELYEILAPITPHGIKDIDIVFLQRAPLELRFNVVRFGKVLFEQDPQRRLDFEEQVMILYADFKPLLTIFDNAILQRI